MTERIAWNGEKKAYQPRIKNSRIHDLWLIKEATHRPLTVLVDEALDIFITNTLVMLASLNTADEIIDRNIDESMNQPMTNDSWEDLTTYLDLYAEGNNLD